MSLKTLEAKICGKLTVTIYSLKKETETKTGDTGKATIQPYFAADITKSLGGR
jgi:hypothetical protein